MDKRLDSIAVQTHTYITNISILYNTQTTKYETLSMYDIWNIHVLIFDRYGLIHSIQRIFWMWLLCFVDSVGGGLQDAFSVPLTSTYYTYSFHHVSQAASKTSGNTRVGTLIAATIYLQLIQNRYMFRSFTVLHCNHQHCEQPVASDVEVVGYL